MTQNDHNRSKSDFKMQIKNKIVISTAIGGGLELFDFVIYLFISPLIASLFFPHSKDGIGFLATLGGFAAGYFARPLGGIIYGHFGDRIGRRRTFTYSLFLMAIPTFCMSCLPTYAVAGIAAPVLLIVFRFAQGLAMGGDVAGAICFIGEHVITAQRGFMTSCLIFGMNMGAVIANIVVAALTSLLSASAMLSWGWRIPFLIGALLAMVGFYIRKHTSETPEFKKYLSMNSIERWPLKTLLRDHSRSIIFGFIAAGLAAGITSIMSLFMATYMSHYAGVPSRIALWLNSISICAYSFSCLAIGFFMSRFHPLQILQTGAIIFLILAYPIFTLILSHNLLLVMLGLLIAAPLMASIMSSIPALLIELFPTPIRYSGIGVSYNFGFSLFGGLSPFLVALLITTTGIKIIPAFFIMFMVVLTLPAILILRNKMLPLQKIETIIPVTLESN